MRTAFLLLLLLALLSSAVFTRAQGREQTLQIPAPPSADAIGTRIDPANRSEPAVNTYVREVTISGPTRINRSGLEYYEVKGTIEGIGWGGASGGVRYESHYTYKVPYVLRVPVGWHGTLVAFRHGNAAFEAWACLERLFGPRSIGRVFQDYGDRVVSDAALHPMRQWAYFSVNYTPLAIDGRPSSFLLPGTDDDNDGRIDEDPLQDDDRDGLEDEDNRDNLDNDGDGLVDEDVAVDDDGDGRANEDPGRTPIATQGDVTIQRDTTLLAKYLLKRLTGRAPTLTFGTGHSAGAVMSLQLNTGIDSPRVTGRQLRVGDDFSVAYDSTGSKIFDGFLLFGGNYSNAVIDPARGLPAPSLLVNGEADNTAIGAVRLVRTMLDRGLNATSLVRVYMIRNVPHIDSDFVRAEPCGPACFDPPDFFRGAGDRLRALSGALLDALYRWVVDGTSPPQSVFNGIPTDVNGDGVVDSLRFPQSSRTGPASTFFFPFVDDPSLDQSSGPLTNMQNNVALASLWASVEQSLNARVDSIFLPEAACRRGSSSFVVQGPTGVRFAPYDQRTFLSVWGSFAAYQTCRINAVDGLIASGLYDPTVATIDIRPDEFPNRIDARSSGQVPVAIFSTIGFDAAHINAASLRLGGARPASGDRGEIADVNGDGRADLVVNFPARDVTLNRPGDVVVDLEGRTWSGLPFSGTDLVDYVR